MKIKLPMKKSSTKSGTLPPEVDHHSSSKYDNNNAKDGVIFTPKSSVKDRNEEI